MMFLILLATLSAAFACPNFEPCDSAQFVTCSPPPIPAGIEIPCPLPPICKVAMADCPDWNAIECPEFEPCDESQQVTCPPPKLPGNHQLPCQLPPICEVAMADCPTYN